ncbi:MAG: lipoprotein [Xanthomonadales bacterium]|nr:lipoprotein [Xanthomonadales bacterium]
MKRLFILLLLGLSLSACGQKGDLFLKEPNRNGDETEKPIQSSAPQATKFTK